VHTWDSDPNCGPLLFPPIAREFPKARILLGHSGVTWRGYMQAMEAAEAAPSLFLELAGSQHHRLILEQAVERLGAERIVCGSDMPFLEASMTLGHVLTARISDADKERILRTNFLGLVNGYGISKWNRFGSALSAWESWGSSTLGSSRNIR